MFFSIYRVLETVFTEPADRRTYRPTSVFTRFYAAGVSGCVFNADLGHSFAAVLQESLQALRAVFLAMYE